MPSTIQQAPRASAGLEHKSASVSPEGGLIEADDATGVVEAIVSVTGVLDEDRDVIKPGAYAKTLAKRKPKVIFAHDWAKWVARTEHVEELMPGDDRLPKTTKDGKSWPQEAGGLYARCRFNLDTQEGRDAYSNVKFYSETGEAEWSVGYKVPAGKATRTKSGERHIEEMDLFEYSPVLFGANTMSGTLSVKSVATEDAPDLVAEESGEEVQSASEERAGDELTPDDLDDQEAAADTVTEEELEESPTEALDEGSASSEETVGDSRPEEASLATEGKAVFDLTPPPLSQRLELFREWRNLQVPDISDTVMRDRMHASLFRLDQALDQGELSKADVELHIVLSQLRDIGQNPVISSFTEGALRLLRGGGRDEPVGPGAWEHWKSASGEEEKGSRASLDSSPKKNWVENTGELPGYIREVARSIHEKQGMPLDKAIPIAIAQIKKWAAGGEGVDSETKAKAAKALAEWEALKAKNQAQSGKESEVETLESTTYPYLPGTYEELREQLRQRATKTLGAVSAGLAHVEVMGTWQDRAVVTAYQADGKALSYEIPYTLTADGTTVEELEEPVLVELKVTVDGEEEDGQDLLPYPSVIDDVALDLKVLFRHAETKAGRVLSTVNEKRLLAAVESLLAVLKAAGLEVDASPRVKQEKEEEEQIRNAVQYQDSTAPSAQAGAAGKTLLNPTLLARGYRVLGDAHAMGR